MIKTFDNEIVICQIWAEIEAVYVIPEKITRVELLFEKCQCLESFKSSRYMYIA